MYITWPAITALCAVIVLSGGGVALYVRAALADFLEKLDERFVLCPVCQEKHSDLERRIGLCEQLLHS